MATADIGLTDNAKSVDSQARLQQRLDLRGARLPARTDWEPDSEENAEPLAIKIPIPQQPYVNKPRLLFLHIPKSGGTSFDAFLSAHFRLEEILPFELQYGGTLSLEGREFPYRYLHVMSPWDVICQERPDAHVVTMFRDPIRRVLSEYWFLRTSYDIGLSIPTVAARVQCRWDAARSLSLSDWLRIPEGAPTSYPRNLFLSCLTIGVDGTQGLDGPSKSKLLRRAKRVVREGLTFFGVLEEYTRSKELFCRTFGLPAIWIAAEERHNIGSKANQELPDNESLELLRRENAWDLELYDFAREVFGDRCRQFATVPWDDPLSPDAEQSSCADPSLSGCVRIEPHQMRGPGFYREECDATGTRFRWTGAAPVAYLPFAARIPVGVCALVRLELLAAAGETAWNQLELRLNNQSAHDVERSFAAGRWSFRCRFNLPVDACSRTIQMLSIHTPRLRPQGTSDDRTLGVAISDLSVQWSPGAAADSTASPTIQAYPHRAA